MGDEGFDQSHVDDASARERGRGRVSPNLVHDGRMLAGTDQSARLDVDALMALLQ